MKITKRVILVLLISLLNISFNRQIFADIGEDNDGGSYGVLPASGCPSIHQFNLDHFAAVLNMDSCGSEATLKRGRVFRGGEILDSGMECLKSLGITTIIDIRSEAEATVSMEREHAERIGIKYLLFPMSANSHPASNQCAASGLDSIACNRTNVLRAIEALRSIIAGSSDAKIYVHCVRGQDRTGLLLGLYRVLQDHCSKKASWNEMKRYQYNPYPSLQAVWDDLTKNL